MYQSHLKPDEEWWGDEKGKLWEHLIMFFLVWHAKPLPLRVRDLMKSGGGMRRGNYGSTLLCLTYLR